MPEARRLAEKAKVASRALAGTSTAVRNVALTAMADALSERRDEIVAANALDMIEARAKGTPGPLLDRLMLDEKRVDAIASAVREIVALPDPIGEVLDGKRMYNGIWLTQIRVPMGVVGMIYEARPNVTADAAALCVKTGNAVILRGGSLAAASNRMLTTVLAEAAVGAGLPEDSIASIESTDRAEVDELMTLRRLVDLLIPRGGAGLINSIVENAKVPVIETGVGNCHVYIHEKADQAMVIPIVINAKCQRPGVCNAAESLLVDESIYATALPPVLQALAAAGVAIVGDEKTAALGAVDIVIPATEEDWGREYLEMQISVKVVSGLDEAIEHINTYGTRHSESILTEDYDSALKFLNDVDAAAVYVNASTRFTDGGEFGLGAEIGISTQKLHARGPMGLSALTSTKWLGMGSGQIRE
jgi:glutamate-5-semialdehyde dehydrogenase